MQGVPLGGVEVEAVDQGVNGLPAQPERRTAHGGVYPPGAHATEQIQGLFVVGPDVEQVCLVVFKLEAFGPGFSLGVGRLEQRVGNGLQFPKRPWKMAAS